MKLFELSSFNSWFSGSKVVDKEGKPLRVYHSTDKDFDTFHIGSHFGTIKAANSRGGERGKPNTRTIPVFLSIKNPFRCDLMDSNNESSLLNRLLRVVVNNRDGGEISSLEKWNPSLDIKTFNIKNARNNGIFEELQRMGFDGLVYENDYDDDGSDSWVIFRSDQVRFAMSVNEGIKTTLDPKIWQQKLAPLTKKMMSEWKDSNWSWTTGGCFAFAEAFQKAFGGQLYGVCRIYTENGETDYPVDHALVKLNGQFYDYNGIYNRKTVKKNQVIKAASEDGVGWFEDDFLDDKQMSFLFKTMKSISIPVNEAHHAYDDIDYKTEFSPLVKGDTVRLFHGFYSMEDAVLAAKQGLSGALKADRRYSYESNNNPKGLFVTLKLDAAKEFTSKVVMEFVANENELEPPVWPGNGYTVQGQMEKFFSGNDAPARAARNQRRREMQKDTEDLIQKNPEHMKHIAASDDKYKAFMLMSGREYQALFVGHLNPSSITAFWVSNDFKKDGKYATWTRLSVQEFIEKYESSIEKKHRDKKIFLPNEPFNAEKFKKGLSEAVGNRNSDELIRDIYRYYVIDGKNEKGSVRNFADFMGRYLWPKQIAPAFRWMMQEMKSFKDA